MVKSKFRGFVSPELVGVPNTREIRYRVTSNTYLSAITKNKLQHLALTLAIIDS